jgi:hypothetical protein
MFRLNSDGSYDTGFVTSLLAGQQVNDTETLSDGKIIVRYTAIPFPSGLISRFNTDGSIDTSFNTQTTNGDVELNVEALAIQNNGQILIGGAITNVSGNPAKGLARLKSNGDFNNC